MQNRGISIILIALCLTTFRVGHGESVNVV